MDEQLLTAEEVAAYLRVSRATVWRWCQEKRLPAFKIGREWRIHQGALDRLIRERTGPCEAERRQTSAAVGHSNVVNGL